MKKLLLLAVGGTIASVIGNEGLTPVMPPNELIRFLPSKEEPYSVEGRLLMNIVI